MFDDADIDAAVEVAMISKFRNSGQTCVCANRIYAQDGIYETFVEKLSMKIAVLVSGPGMDPAASQGPLISGAALRKVEQHVSDAIEKGARVVVGGKRHKLGGTFFEPTLLADVTSEMRVTHEETFGPVAPVYRFVTDDEVIAQANASPSGLAAYFYTKDFRRVFRTPEALECGMIGINSGLISTEVAPFGGIKQSGVGREGSHHGIEEFTELKYLLLGGLG